MVGQSNMAGRGFLKDVPLIFDEQIKMLRNGKWQTMVEPINYDRLNAGVGLSASFAAAWRMKNQFDDIGLIPCADGGSSLDDWSIDGILFKHAIAQAKLGQKTSKVEGILWHQGENDANPVKALHYNEKFSVIAKAFRDELNNPELPIIMGGLGNFLPHGTYGEHFSAFDRVNRALLDFTKTNSNCYFVTGEGLTSNPDFIHIDAASQRKFGIRYFEAFNSRKNITEPLVDENQILERIYNRPLSSSDKYYLLNLKFSKGELSLESYKEQLSTLEK